MHIHPYIQIIYIYVYIYSHTHLKTCTHTFLYAHLLKKLKNKTDILIKSNHSQLVGRGLSKVHR